MAIGYFNPRPAGGSMGGAVNPRDRYAFDPKTVSAQADNLPPWVIPAIAGAGIGATSLGLWAMHRASGTPYVPGSYSSPNVPFNVGYGNGLGTPPQVAPTSTAMVPTQMGVAPTGTGITVQGPATGGYQTAELLNTAEGQAVAQRMAQARAGMNPTLGSGQLGLNAAPQASLSSGPLGLNSGQLALPQAPPASLGAADAQLALGVAPTATPSYGSGFTMGEAGPVSSAGRPAVTVAELGRAPASTALEPYYGGPGVTSGGATGGGVYGTAAGATSSEIPAALSTGQAAGSLLGGMFSGNMTSGPLARFSGPLAEDAGYLSKFGKSATSGTIARVGLSVGLPYLGSTFGHEFDQRGMTQASQESRGLGRVMGMAGGVAGVPGAIAAAPAYAGTELLSNNQFGNDVLNTVRWSRSGVDINTGKEREINPLAKVATFLNPLTGVVAGINALGQAFGLVDKNREATADTVSDVFGGGESGASKAQAAPLTPEQKAAKVSPESLAATAKDYGLSDAMTQKLLKNYHQQMVMARENASVALPADNEGNVTLDGGQKVAAKDFPGAKQQKDSKGNMVWVTSDPDMVQQKVYDDMRQLIPTLGASQDQEEDFMRKQAVMQSQLEQVLPQLYNPAIWGADPTAQTLAMSESRAIPSRYVQAQALQAQQAYDNQIAQAMQQQQLAAQYPELFGKKSSSSQPATLDAAMAQ